MEEYETSGSYSSKGICCCGAGVGQREGGVGINCVSVGGWGIGKVVCSGNSEGETPIELKNWACCGGM